MCRRKEEEKRVEITHTHKKYIKIKKRTLFNKNFDNQRPSRARRTASNDHFHRQFILSLPLYEKKKERNIRRKKEENIAGPYNTQIQEESCWLLSGRQMEGREREREGYFSFESLYPF
jgi:hypothetical protein